MHILKRFITLFLAFTLLLTLPVSVHAEQESTNALIRKILNYFQYYQADAGLDYELLLGQIAKQDPALAKTWSEILDFWMQVNGDMEFHKEVLPDCLPEDDTLCIAVMGYQLNSDGSMRDELYERLHVTLASAEKYPNAYILCTGGGTASKKEKVTEAGQMAKRLIKKGISEDRIIVEDNALSTIENGKYGCRILYRDYPQVKTVAVITSDYHIFRSCLYFNTQAALQAYDLQTEPIRVLSNATCRISPKATSDLETQVEVMSIITGLDVEDLSKPKLSRLTGIDIGGKTEYESGEELELTVSAIYSSGYSREVTQGLTFSGFDFGKAGPQAVTVTYVEDGLSATDTIEIRINVEEPVVTEPAQPVETAPIPETAPEAPEHADLSPADTRPDMTGAFLFAGVCVVLLIVLICLKIRQTKRRRARRRPRPVIKLD